MANLTPTPAYTGAVRALEPTDYAVPALWDDIHQVLLNQDAWLRERILATQSGAEVQAGAITDVHLGNRTVTDATAPAADANTLQTLLSNLGNRIKAITGASSWRDAPATTLAAAKAHADATTGVHGATSTAAPSTLIIRDAAGRAKVAAPSASDDIARKADVDAVQSGIESTHIGAGGNAHALVTTTVHGFMSSTDKVKLNAYPTTATSAATANAAMVRDASGRAKVAAPSAQDDIARKLEVDTVAAALASHTHAWGDITSKPTTFTPSAHTHSGADITSGTLPVARLGTTASESTWVMGRLAAASRGVVGAYAFAFKTTSGTATYGDLEAGNALRPADTANTTDPVTVFFTGTWECLGYAPQNKATLWRRIS